MNAGEPAPVQAGMKKAPKVEKVRASCDCVSKMDAALVSKHHRLVTLFQFPSFQPLPLVAVEKTEDAPRGTKLLSLACTHCPFCGVKVAMQGAEEKAAVTETAPFDKEEFQKQGLRMMRALGEALALGKYVKESQEMKRTSAARSGTFIVHWNPGGIAVSGEIMLRSSTFCAQLSASLASRTYSMWYRMASPADPYGTHSKNLWAPPQFIGPALEAGFGLGAHLTILAAALSDGLTSFGLHSP